jgi:hypothetical protein
MLISQKTETIKSVVACARHLILAGSVTDNQDTTGVAIPTKGYNAGQVVVGIVATLGAGETVSIRLQRQESANGSDWDTAETVVADGVVLTAGDAGTYEKVCCVNQNVAELKAYVRYNVKLDLSRANTDTASHISNVVLTNVDGTLPIATIWA